MVEYYGVKYNSGKYHLKIKVVADTEPEEGWEIAFAVEDVTRRRCCATDDTAMREIRQ
jgi:hypothetical protein